MIIYGIFNAIIITNEFYLLFLIFFIHWPYIIQNNDLIARFKRRQTYQSCSFRSNIFCFNTVTFNTLFKNEFTSPELLYIYMYIIYKSSFCQPNLENIYVNFFSLKVIS